MDEGAVSSPGSESTEPVAVAPTVGVAKTPAADAINPVAWWSPGAWLAVISLAAATASVWQIGLGRTDRGFFVLAVTSIVLTAAAVVDAACRRIPNRLTYPAIVLGLALNVAAPLLLSAMGARLVLLWLGATTPTDALLGFGLCAILGIGSFAAGGLGGGDAKVLAMVGAFLGLSGVLPVLFNAILFAAVVGVTNLLAGGRLVGGMQKLALTVLRTAWPSLTTNPPATFRRGEAPFAVSLLLGFALAQVYSPLDDFVHLFGSHGAG